MTRKIISFFLAALMLMTTLAAGTTVSAKLPFNDTDGHWGESSIEYVVNKGLMNGVGDGTSFAPNMSLTRGMVVTVLYRDNGSPKQTFSGTFLDVKEGMYYTAAAEWAFANGIVNGTGTDEWGEPYFSPDRDITRQELATMFKRYADFKDVNTNVGSADISTFPDAANVASWASDAVKWAVGVGLITGKANGGAATISPVDKAVRAEFATIIKRFKEADFEYHLIYNSPTPISTYTELPYAKVENADVYVAVDGSDSNPGTKDKPLATFEAAKLKVRELKKTAKDEIIVAFKGGDYGVLNNVTLSAEDSGTEKVPVTYCAYGDGEVYFTNGIYIDSADFVALDDSEKSIFNSAEVDNIKKISLANHPAADKITAFSTLSNSNGFCWQARTPNKRDGVDSYYPGMTMNVATPDSPYTMEYIMEQCTKYGYDVEHTIIRPYTEQKMLKALHSLKTRMDTYHSYENVQLCGYVSKVWEFDVLNIKTYDKTTGVMEFHNESIRGFVNVDLQQQAFVSNVSEELDDKGEYWIDNNTKTLYVYKPEGNYSMATDGTFLTIDRNVNYISLVKLNFRICGDANAINAHGDNFTMDQCSVTYVGGSRAIFSSKALNVTIKNTTVAYCSESGICIDGPKTGDREDYDYNALKGSGLVIENNLVHDVCLVYVPVESGAISISWQVGARVAHNEIYNSARYGIDYKYGNIDCIFEYNYLHHCMQNSADGGAFYCGRVAINRGNEVRYNIVADIYALNPSVHTGGTYAIYLDDSMENLICYGNVFYNCGTIMNNGGRSHEIYDNVFIGNAGIHGKSGNFADITMYADPKADNHYYSEGWNSLNRIPDENTPNGQIWKAKWPELYDIVAIRKDPSCYKETDLYKAPLNYCHNNYHFDGAVSDFYDEWIELSDHENNVEVPDGENPFFVNPATGNYSIKSGANIMDNHFAKIGRY